MKVEVEVISNEIIKPSSPTPELLGHYELSFIDQLTPKTYNPLVLFYDLDVDHQDESSINEISNKIKKSLSEVLTLYYPLAGRVEKDRYVYCNDEGVSYSIALVNSTCHLSDVIQNPLPSELCNFLPFELHELTEFALGVQLNIFQHGGIAVGLCISHQLADALSCIIFVKSWVAVARGEADRIARPEFVSAKLFPPVDDPKFDPNVNVTKKAVSKRFVFEASTIEAIRSKYEEKPRREDKKRPSRVEALSTFIWSRFAASTNDEHSAQSEKVYLLIHPVNIRPKLDPPLPEHTFGNLYRCGYSMFPSSALTTCSSEEYGYEVVRQIRKGIKKVDMDFLKMVQQGQDVQLEFIMEYAKDLIMKGGQLVSLSFTSLCRFPLYDADFGWGKPRWVSSAALTFNNVVAFMDTKAGNGIEAYIALKKEHMTKLETDEEFLKAISPVG
ncbi:Transferase [Parasponia andersonii]|uniref:Transferase n=1 Tax=Parasponia andersonii TaxID=3476 RepID=A0A2P5AT57_PARAD|nr:Transferase [Parasponia andersonii]